MNEQTIEPLRVLVPVAALAFLLALGLIVLSRPWLARYAIAQPNSRSSHREPTPQGGGIAVVVATLLVAWGAVAVWPAVVQNQGAEFVAVSAATALLAAVGARDDLRSLPAAVRLAMQCVAVGTVIAALPGELQVVPQVPWWIEHAGLFLGGVWLVNLVNLMDGIDWMTVAEFVPVTGAPVLLGLSGTIGLLPSLVAARGSSEARVSF
jgi:UDP-N-acetylmuramyl pentapeptide phosphotransferase/UDP-N-acetylglucosamine-1-phosphate transferase